MADTRNFRSSYLEKVGIKGVEEKKSLEILLKEQPLDPVKLSQFILRFPIPSSFRLLLWKVLLDVLPVYSEAQEFVNEQRKHQYNDMREALQVMGRVNSETPLCELHLRMNRINEGSLPFDDTKMFQDEDDHVFIVLNNTISDMTDDPIDAFWISAKFYAFQHKHLVTFASMAEKVEGLVKKEDTAGDLYEHLVNKAAFNTLPFKSWFHLGFAGILPENCIERIWDKVIGGSCQVLLYVAVSILLTLKRPILSRNTADDILKYLNKVPDSFGDRTVTNALDLWQKHGSPL